MSFTNIIAFVAGCILVLAILWEGFEVIVLPRRVTRRLRFSVSLYRALWRVWRKGVDGCIPRKRQEAFLGIFGPLFFLVVLSTWAGGLILGFALLHWGCGSSLQAVSGQRGFPADLYLSGTTFFTLGIGDVVPTTNFARLLTVLESGIGFGFLALVISFLPPLNQSFSRRESTITLLDARAGSPPSAGEMLRRHSYDHGLSALEGLLKEWEIWSAEFLEEHISYPMLAYFRSQHSNQSWLGALAAILDTCALVMIGKEGTCKRQAELTFAIARHAVVDLTLVFKTRPTPPAQDRLPPDLLAELCTVAAAAGLALDAETASEALAALRHTYEPHVNALATLFHLQVPPWIPEGPTKDNWQASPWAHIREGRREPTTERAPGEHF